MTAGLLFGCLVPHPPVLLPEVGGGMASEVLPTVEAIERLGRRIAEYEPQTLVLVSPHGPLQRGSMGVGMAPNAQGDFANFRAPQVKIGASCDTELADAIRRSCERIVIPVMPVDHLTRDGLDGSMYWLDHGAAVPLHFLLPLLGNVRVVLLGFSYLPRATHKTFGARIAEACAAIGRRAVFVASGDLSHRLSHSAPAGYDPLGQVFDEEVVAGLAGADWDRISNLPEHVVERAGVCGYLPILMLAGALGDAVETRLLSYQCPFGVGYAVAQVEQALSSAALGTAVAAPEASRPASDVSAPGEAMLAEANAAAAVAPRDAPAALRQAQLALGRVPDDEPLASRQDQQLAAAVLALARASLESHVRTGQRPEPPAELAEELMASRACFVTLRLNGQLRGCIGTIVPTQPRLAAEVIDNAIGAGTRDPRFPPVAATELAGLAYSVDVLSELQPVSSLEGLDPALDGLVVRQGLRVGVLLPGIPEVRDARQQFELCCQKAGITGGESVELLRFSVTRYAEPGAEH